MKAELRGGKIDGLKRKTNEVVREERTPGKNQQQGLGERGCDGVHESLVHTAAGEAVWLKGTKGSLSRDLTDCLDPTATPAPHVSNLE